MRRGTAIAAALAALAGVASSILVESLQLPESLKRHQGLVRVALIALTLLMTFLAVHAARTRADVDDTDHEAADTRAPGPPSRVTNTVIISSELSTSRAPSVPPHDISDVFVGRAGDMRRLCDIIRQTNRAIVVGVGGMGKSSLARAACDALAAEFPDGRMVLPLRGADGQFARSPDDVITECLARLSEPTPDTPSARCGAYLSALDRRRMVLVLDDASGFAQVEPLLPRSPSCAVVITSRNSLPRLGIDEVRLRPMDAADAALLFRTLTRGHPQEHEESGRFLEHLCYHVPLLIKTHTRQMLVLGLSVGDYVDMRATAGRGGVDVVAEADIAWSLGRTGPGSRGSALSGAASDAFALLAAVPWRDFPVWVVPALLDVEPDRALAVLDELVTVCFVERAGDAMTARLTIHDVVRQWAAPMVQAGEARRAVRRAARAFADAGAWIRDQVEPDRPVAERARPLDLHIVLPHRYTQAPQTWFEDERANVPALIRQAASLELWEETYDLAATLPTLMIIGGAWGEWEDALRLGITSASSLGDARREAFALQRLHNMVRAAGDWVQSRELIDASLALFSQLGDETGIAYLLIDRAVSELHSAEESADATAREALERWQRLDRPRWEAEARRLLGLALERQGRYEDAVVELLLALEAFEGTGDTRWAAFTRTDVGRVYTRAGMFDHACDVLEDALGTLKSLHEPKFAAQAALSLVDVRLAASNVDEGTELAEFAQSVLTQLHEPYWPAQAKLALAKLAVATGGYDCADSLIRECTEVFVDLGARQALRDAEDVAAACRSRRAPHRSDEV